MLASENVSRKNAERLGTGNRRLNEVRQLSKHLFNEHCPDVDSPGKNTRSRKRLNLERPVSSKRKKVDAGEKLYEVEKLMDVRSASDGKTGLSKREFLIRWKGYAESDDTWTAEEDLTSPPESYNRDPVCTEKLESFILNL